MKKPIDPPDGTDEARVSPTLGESLLRLQILAVRSKPGPRGKIAYDIALILNLLNATGGNVEQARTRFIVKQTGKPLTDLTPDERSVVSKRFTRAMKKILGFNKPST